MSNRYHRLVTFNLLLLFLIGCASGSVIVTGTVRPATDPQSVKFYLKEPRNYETIGLVEASSDSGFTEQGSKDYAVSELKKQAAKIGATGVLLTATGDQTSTMVGGYGTGVIWAVPVNAKVVRGTAIFVNAE